MRRRARQDASEVRARMDGMTIQEIEKQIARKVIDDALAAGYTIDVFALCSPVCSL